MGENGRVEGPLCGCSRCGLRIIWGRCGGGPALVRPWGQQHLLQLSPVPLLGYEPTIFLVRRRLEIVRGYERFRDIFFGPHFSLLP